MAKALIIIDLQNEYFRGGRRELVGIDAATQNAAAVLHACRQMQIPVIFIQHLAAQADYDAFLPGSIGAQINDGVKPFDEEIVFQKNFPNSFRNTNLRDQLLSLDIDELIICGAMSHMCVEATVRAAFDFGFKNIVIKDACATKDLDFEEKIIPAQQVHEAFMAALSPVYAQTTTAQKLIETILI